MIEGEKIQLRARIESDVPVLHAELQDDVVGRSRSDSRPWRPISPGTADSPYAVNGLPPEVVVFSVVETRTRELAGAASMWGIDTHNRLAHLGIGLRPAYRGRGLGTDVVRALCHYGFVVRGLHRIQLETLADNTGMITAATRAGFRVEGTLRRAAWVYGSFLDEVVLGLLAEEWTP
ncbi:GNAT family N-acetyltransferase [Streptomyces sp. NPDC088197]|uniref:GNAT family N-acetyltransferase n=1 Tax=Streptomyces sp. NPDC088197 TaxID=3365840 RepID=UPI0038212369